ncbi:MAG: hypothetical protein ACXVCM_22825 [Ktedonobacteraceae bacterium]
MDHTVHLTVPYPIVVNDPTRERGGLRPHGRKPVVVQPQFPIPEAGRRRNYVRQVRAPFDATSVGSGIDPKKWSLQSRSFVQM